MIKINSTTFDETFCKIIENNVNMCWEMYINFNYKVWLIPLYPIIIRNENRLKKGK